MNNPNGPIPLAIIRGRDIVKVTADILKWVKESTSGREDQDPKNYDEIRFLIETYESLSIPYDVFLCGRDRNEEVKCWTLIIPRYT